MLVEEKDGALREIPVEEAAARQDQDQDDRPKRKPGTGTDARK